jgi:hypothetical protein
MTRTLFLCSTLALAAIACGGDDAADDDGVVIVDSGPPDAFVPVCEETTCGDECVDTSSDSANCGGCGMACDSPGQICSGALPCACPEAFVPAEIDADAPFGQMRVVQDTTIGFGGFFAGDRIDALVVAFDGETPIGMDFALTAAIQTPGVIAAYDVDVQAGTAHTAYAVDSGTLNLSAACAEGVAGVLTDVTLVEIDATTGVVVDGGCSFMVPTIDFAIGGDCAP